MKYREQIFIPVKFITSKLHKNNRLYHKNNRLYIIDNEHLKIKSDEGNNCYNIWETRPGCVRQIFKRMLNNDINYSESQVLEDKESFFKNRIESVRNCHASLNEYKNIDICDLNYIIRKYIADKYPGVLEYFDKIYPDMRCVVRGIEKAIINFSLKLKKNNLLNDFSESASKSWIIDQSLIFLKEYGYCEKPGFNEAWEMLTNLNRLRENIK